MTEYLSDRDLVVFSVPGFGSRVLSCDMPRLPNESLQGVAFLYRTREEAAANAQIGGTCFLVSKFAPQMSEAFGKNMYVPFWVSNRHVIWDSAAPVVRLNKRGGGTKIIDYDCLDWIPHSSGDDLAAVCAFGNINMVEDEIRGVPDSYFITEEKVSEWQLGIGDDVAMFGRFINHQGRNTIKPAARLGSISMMPQPIWDSQSKKDQISYAVEMRSRTGFSGSPVAMYRIPGTALMELPTEIQSVHGLLGVCWGHILDDEDGENTYLNGVIPAWRLLDLFEEPKLKEQLKAADSIDPESINRYPSAVPLAAAPPTTADNPDHREDFNRLLDAAVSGNKSDPETS